MALYGLEPWGDEWRQAATLAALIYSAHRARGSPKLQVNDFIPATLAPVQRQTPEEMWTTMMAFTAFLTQQQQAQTDG